MNPAAVSSACEASRGRGFQSGASRPSYHVLASDHRLAAGMISPIGISCCADHVWTCSSDLKNLMVCQV